jgi:hypothetical protein
MSLIDQIADVSVTATTSTQTRAGFGTLLLAVCKVPWTSGARVRTYGSLAAMVTAGFLTMDPAYEMARAAFAQNPAPTRVKVGQRNNLFTQIVHLIPAAPVSGSATETYTAEVDGLSASFTSDATPTVAEVRTGLAAAINVLTGVDVDAIIATGGSTTGTQTLTGASLDGATGGDTMTPPRRLSFTFSSHADWDATMVTVEGLDQDGEGISETFLIPNGGNATVEGSTYFASVTSVVIPAQSGSGGTFTMGVRASVTATVSGSSVVCTSAVAGRLHRFKLVTGNLTMQDETAAVSGFETDLNQLLAFDPDWYGLALDSNSQAEVQVAAAWTETNKKFFAYQTADSDCGDPSVTADVMSVLKAAAYSRSLGFYYPGIGLSTGWVAAAALGKDLPTTPGSATLAFKTLAGVTRLSVSDSFIAAIVTTPDTTGKNGNLYLDFNGTPATFPGMMAVGEWADVVRGLDDFRSDVRARFLSIQLTNGKVPFTDNGTDLFRAAVIASIKARIKTGLFAASPAFTVVATPVAETSALDRSARRFNGISYSAPLAGAILYVTAAGTAAI